MENPDLNNLSDIAKASSADLTKAVDASTAKAVYGFFNMPTEWVNRITIKDWIIIFLVAHLEKNYLKLRLYDWSEENHLRSDNTYKLRPNQKYHFELFIRLTFVY